MKRILGISLVLVSLSVAAHGQFIFVFLNKKPDAEKLSEEATKKIMDGHFANMERLAKEGKLIAAGPFEGGGGIFILKTTSTDSAKFWISPDTGIKANRWNVELLPYSPRVGNFCAVSAPYQMTMYFFVRYKSSGEKTPAQFSSSLKKHDDYLAKLVGSPEIITEGIFTDHSGGILITKSEIKKEELESDPAVKEGGFQFEVKQLYIAKGSFCEK